MIHFGHQPLNILVNTLTIIHDVGCNNREALLSLAIGTSQVDSIFYDFPQRLEDETDNVVEYCSLPVFECLTFTSNESWIAKRNYRVGLNL